MVDLGILILRVALGLCLIPHGVYKFQNKQYLDKKWLEEYGLPLGSVPLAGVVQILGGLALFLGVYNTLNSLLQLFVMLVATWVCLFKHREPFLSTPKGKGWDVNLLLIGALIALVVLGGGKWSLIGW